MKDVERTNIYAQLSFLRAKRDVFRSWKQREVETLDEIEKQLSDLERSINALEERL